MTNTFRVGGHEVPGASRVSPKVLVGASPGRGRGLFGAEAIAAGERVLVWGGESYCGAEEAAAARERGLGTMQWDDDLFSREAEDLDDAFAINHSCEPNVWLEGAFFLTAMREIRPGEELTLDYATVLSDEDDAGDWDCRCGAPGCRGRVTGSDWRIAEVRERYAGHFTPLLEKRIAADTGPRR